jgi:hypothetical protein
MCGQWSTMPFTRDQWEGVLDYWGYLYDLPIRTNDPYLGIYWVFPEDSPLFPECHPETSILFHKTRNRDSKSLSDRFYESYGIPV